MGRAADAAAGGGKGRGLEDREPGDGAGAERGEAAGARRSPWQRAEGRVVEERNGWVTAGARRSGREPVAAGTGVQAGGSGGAAESASLGAVSRAANRMASHMDNVGRERRRRDRRWRRVDDKPRTRSGTTGRSRAGATAREGRVPWETPAAREDRSCPPRVRRRGCGCRWQVGTSVAVKPVGRTASPGEAGPCRSSEIWSEPGAALTGPAKSKSRQRGRRGGRKSKSREGARGATSWRREAGAPRGGPHARGFP